MRGTVWLKKDRAETEVETLETPWYSKTLKKSSFLPLLGWSYSMPNSFLHYMM